jgi:hypothetical protein
VYASKANMALDLVETTVGVVFFGTPHRGSQLATLTRFIPTIAHSSSDVRSLLGTGSTVLKNLDVEFLRIPRVRNGSIKTYSFYEARRTLYKMFCFNFPIFVRAPNIISLGSPDF